MAPAIVKCERLGLHVFLVFILRQPAVIINDDHLFDFPLHKVQDRPVSRFRTVIEYSIEY